MPAALEKCSIKFEFDNSEIRLVLAWFFNFIRLSICMCYSYHRVMNRKNTLGKPDQRDLNENLAATQGLAHMIQECRKLFLVSMTLSFSTFCPTYTQTIHFCFKKKSKQNLSSISHARQRYQNSVQTSGLITLHQMCLSVIRSSGTKTNARSFNMCRHSRYRTSVTKTATKNLCWIYLTINAAVA